MRASPVAWAVVAVLLTAGLTACGGSSEESAAGVRTSGRQLKAFESELLHPHRFTLKQVKAAFLTRGITLRKMRNPGGGRVVVLFDPGGTLRPLTTTSESNPRPLSSSSPSTPPRTSTSRKATETSGLPTATVRSRTWKPRFTGSTKTPSPKALAWASVLSPDGG